MKFESTIGEVIEGNYRVEDVIRPEGDSTDTALWRTVAIGSLALADGEYTFTQREDVDISENLSNRFFFLEDAEGRYELVYDYGYQPSQNVMDVADGEFFAMLRLFGENSTDNGFGPGEEVFLITYNEKNTSVYLHSFASEMQLWYIGKSLTE